MNKNKDSVLSIINDTTLTDEELCSFALNCAPITNPIINWNISLPDVPKPPVNPIIPPSVTHTIFTFSSYFLSLLKFLKAKLSKN